AMKRQGVRGNFTRRENLHLTLAFIGEYSDPEAVREVIDQMDYDGFEIGLDGIGAFGNLWWTGIGSADGEELRTVTRKLRHGLADAGIPFDRKKFSPHITLLRKAQSPDGRIPENVIDGIPYASMFVDHISLMRSDRGKHGMIYTEIE
ncbi:MAG: RNA 2',3'-cyclic phosphodiesterase, partial [Bacillota bacterium]